MGKMREGEDRLKSSEEEARLEQVEPVEPESEPEAEPVEPEAESEPDTWTQVAPARADGLEEDVPERSGRNIALFIVIGIVALLVVGTGVWLALHWSDFIEAGVTIKSYSDDETVLVESGDHAITFDAEGSLTVKETYAAPAPTRGTVAEVAVSEGDEVQKGQLLYRMEDPDLQTELEQAQQVQGQRSSELAEADARLAERANEYNKATEAVDAAQSVVDNINNVNAAAQKRSDAAKSSSAKSASSGSGSASSSQANTTQSATANSIPSSVSSAAQSALSKAKEAQAAAQSAKSRAQAEESAAKQASDVARKTVDDLQGQVDATTRNQRVRATATAISGYGQGIIRGAASRIPKTATRIQSLSPSYGLPRGGQASAAGRPSRRHVRQHLGRNPDRLPELNLG